MYVSRAHACSCLHAFVWVCKTEQKSTCQQGVNCLNNHEAERLHCGLILFMGTAVCDVTSLGKSEEGGCEQETK